MIWITRSDAIQWALQVLAWNRDRDHDLKCDSHSSLGRKGNNVNGRAGSRRMEIDMAEELGIISLEQNLSDVERPPEVPVGRYVAEIQSVEVKTSGAGNDYFAMKMLVPQEMIPADVAEHYEDGAIFFYNRLLVPKASDRRSLWNLRQFVEKLGLDTTTSEIDPNEWMNQSVGVVIGTEKNLEGEMRSTIKSLFAAEDAQNEAQAVAAPEPAKVATGRGRRR